MLAQITENKTNLSLRNIGKNMAKIILIIYCIIAALLLAPFLYFAFDRVGNCASDGYVWDDNLKECRKDCLHWNEKKGCIKLSDEEVAEFEKCKYQKPACYAPIYDKMFPKKCLDYDSAYNLDEKYCDFDFNLKDCRKLEGNWLYPKSCK